MWNLGALPAGQTILYAVGNLFADGCQVEELLFAEAVFGLFGKLPIHRRLGSKVIIPIHARHCLQDLSPMGDRIKFAQAPDHPRSPDHPRQKQIDGPCLRDGTASSAVAPSPWLAVTAHRSMFGYRPPNISTLTTLDRSPSSVHTTARVAARALSPSLDVQVPYEIANDLYLLDIVVRDFHARELALDRQHQLDPIE